MEVEASFWKGRRVFLTGHTGFKGGWLALWLKQMGAEVYGYSLAPSTSPALWDVASLNQIPHTLSDIRNTHDVALAVSAFQPEVILHLAAQPLVRASYETPIDTYATNVMGTLHVLEAARHCKRVRAILVVTTDKCYENQEWHWPYRESDSLGGHDPYSSSKACAEILCASYRKSFLNERGIALATARAGNVLGGGDWSADRLVPDIFRAWERGEELVLRYPHAVRPWQHVMDPLTGYLLLAQRLLESPEGYSDAWDFGPDSSSVATVQTLVSELATHWPEARWRVADQTQPHEATLLTLDSSRARSLLSWAPRWSLPQTLAQTVAWQRAWQEGRDMNVFTREQIALHQGQNYE